MEIYAVQSGDSIDSIAQKYGITVEKLIQDNGITRTGNLVTGQTLVITYPKQTYIVQPGDTLESVARSFDIPIMQLLRNNPFLSNRRYLIPNENIIISYDTVGSITTNGLCYPYINQNTLNSTLPNLTYLTIFNYMIAPSGELISYQDDTNTIKTTKEYGTIPLILLTTLSSIGEQNLELAYKILLSEELQEVHINKTLEIIESKGYQGINIVFYYLNETNQEIYLNFIKKIFEKIQGKNLYFFITVNFTVSDDGQNVSVAKVNYEKFTPYITGFIFIQFVWGTNYGPPAPVSSINYINKQVKYASEIIPVDQIIIGKPILGYDWSLPYRPNISNVFTLSINSVLGIAQENNSIIQFDEISQTPYFYYSTQYYIDKSRHIIWFIDARSIDALNNTIEENGINGSGIWNIMIYNPQLWSIINSRFDIIKLI